MTPETVNIQIWITTLTGLRNKRALVRADLDGETARSGETMYSQERIRLPDDGELKPSLQKHSLIKMEGVTARESLLRQLYDTRDFADCCGSGVCLSRPPAAKRVRRKYSRDHFRSEF